MTWRSRSPRSWQLLKLLAIASLGTLLGAGLVARSRPPAPPSQPASPRSPLASRPSEPQPAAPTPAPLPVPSQPPARPAIRPTRTPAVAPAPAAIATPLAPPARPHRPLRAAGEEPEREPRSPRLLPSVPTSADSRPDPPARPRLLLSPQETAELAAISNTEVRNAQLDRRVQRAALATAASEFDLQLTPSFTARVDASGRDRLEAAATALQVGACASLLLPTGGRLSLTWQGEWRSRRDRVGRTLAQTCPDAPAAIANPLAGDLLFPTSTDPLRQSVAIAWVQPLLRDAGAAITYNRLRRARLTDRIARLRLLETRSAQITAALRDYRRLLAAQERRRTAQQSLRQGEANLERQRALVAAGREARFTVRGFEQSVAAVRSQLLAAEAAAATSRQRLLNRLGLDPELPIAAEDLGASPVPGSEAFEVAALQRRARQQRPDYQIAQLEVERARLTWQQARNQRRWQLDLASSYVRRSGQQSALVAQVLLRRELGTQRATAATVARRRAAWQQRQNDLAQLGRDLDAAIASTVARLQVQQAAIAQTEAAVQAASADLEAQQALLALSSARSGVDYNDVQRAQTRLFQARATALQARIDYLNLLTDLDRATGTVLARWGIDPASDRDEAAAVPLPEILPSSPPARLPEP